MTKLTKIIKNINQVESIVQQEQTKNKQNSSNYLTVQPVENTLKKTVDFSTEFEPVSGYLDETEGIIALYKQWDVEVYTLSKELYEANMVESQLNDILPYMNYQIIFKESEPNDISFYNTHSDLHTSYFFEVQEYLLILHASFYINKIFNGKDLIIPEAKLRLFMRSPLTFNQ